MKVTQSRNKREGWYQGDYRQRVYYSASNVEVSSRHHRRTRQAYAKLHKPEKLYVMEIGRIEGFQFITNELL